MNENFNLPFWYLHFFQLLSALNESKNENTLYGNYHHLCGYLNGLYCADVIESECQSSLFNLCNAALDYTNNELSKSQI